MADETNPRSLAFQLTTLAVHVANLPRQQIGSAPLPEADQIKAAQRVVLEPSRRPYCRVEEIQGEQ
ncbi:MAG: alpha-E domain-containing protein [Verrucomicrobiota bacterium]